MAYVSLYRKYRPQTFGQIVGQEHVTRTLAQAIAGERLHHAYLFTGPRGTGKTSTARILAKSVNCVQGPTPEPDNTCVQCQAITSGSSIDVIEIDAASHGGVDDVRDLRDRVAFAPASARSKVYIVDECHMLSTAGWNAFLKTVEEPPGHVIFVFATTEPHKVLDTILSRTQRFDFKRIPTDRLADHIRSVGEQEGLSFEPGAVDLIVREGDGSARDAMSVLEQVAAFTGTSVTVAGVLDVLGASPESAVDDMVSALSDGDVGAVCLLVQRLADAGHDLRQFSRDAVEHLRAVFMVQVAPDSSLVEGTAEALERLRAQSGMLGRVELLRTIELLAEAQAQMRRGNTRLPLEVALAKACMADASGDTAALAARMDRLERRVADAPAAVAPGPRSTPVQRPVGTEHGAPQPVGPGPVGGGPAGSGPEPEVVEPEVPERGVPERGVPERGVPERGVRGPEVPKPAAAARPGGAPAASNAGDAAAHGAPADDLLARVQGAWPQVMDAVKGASKRIHAMATLATPRDVVDGQVVLGFPAGYGFHAEQCGGDRSQTVIGGAMEQVLGVRARLRCVVDEGGAPPPAVEDTEREDQERVEAADVAETEAAEEAGDLPDPATVHRQAVVLVERDLGGQVLETDDEGQKGR